MCDFGKGFEPPEMVKKRPVVVISKKLKGVSGLCTVVAISTVKPSPIEEWHCLIPEDCMPDSRFFQGKESWIKGDMIYRVGFHRLDRIKLGRDPKTGKRLYFKSSLETDRLNQIYSCVLASLGLGYLSHRE